MDIRRKAREYIDGFFGVKAPKLTEQDMIDFASRIQREAIEECCMVLEENWEGLDTHNRDAFISFMQKLRK